MRDRRLLAIGGALTGALSPRTAFAAAAAGVLAVVAAGLTWHARRGRFVLGAQ